MFTHSSQPVSKSEHFFLSLATAKRIFLELFAGMQWHEGGCVGKLASNFARYTQVERDKFCFPELLWLFTAGCLFVNDANHPAEKVSTAVSGIQHEF